MTFDPDNADDKREDDSKKIVEWFGRCTCREESKTRRSLALFDALLKLAEHMAYACQLRKDLREKIRICELCGKTDLVGHFSCSGAGGWVLTRISSVHNVAEWKRKNDVEGSSVVCVCFDSRSLRSEHSQDVP